jgi:heme a synthase
MLEGAYGIHKFSHYVLGAALLWWTFTVRKHAEKKIRQMLMLSLFFALAEVAMGLGMHHLAVPRILQPLHLLFATLLFASHFLALRWVWMLKPEFEAER